MICVKKFICGKYRFKLKVTSFTFTKRPVYANWLRCYLVKTYQANNKIKK